tara:strand:- start:7596 stop:7919 length:324 start_codon:yes stop_codon:yes gene_type:complete
LISFQDFQKTELKVAKILSIEDIEDKDKLYKIKISLGEEERQIVAGLKQFYLKDELEGKNIVVVANLEPATIAGIESQAMLLAAKDAEGKYKVVEIDEAVEPGSKIE